MYRPPHFAVDDRTIAFDAIEARPLATLVTVAEGQPAVTHAPVLLDRADGSLCGHVAAANPHWRAGDADATAIFMLADAYVTPGWYAAKAEHGRVVPTWNYVAVHVRGRLAWLHEAADKRAIVARLTAAHEAREAKPWSIDDAPPDYVEKMLTGIVGFRLSIEAVEAQFKLSQNRDESDRSQIELGLGARDDASSSAVAALMRRYRPRG